MARNLFEAFARAGSTGLGVAANNVIPMYQYKQRMAQEEQDRVSMENWRQQQLAAQQQNAERQAGADQMRGYYGMMEAYLKNQQPQEIDYPKTINEGMARGIATGDKGMISAFSPYWSQQNSVENRPVREPEEKRPPNYAQKFTSRMEDLWNNYTYQMQLPEGQRRPGLAQPNPEQVFSREFEPEAAGYGLNTDSIRTLVNLPPKAPQAFGNSDKMLSPHQLGPQAGQKLTPNEDSWGSMQFDDWNDLTADEKAAVIRKARSEGKL